MGVQDCVHTKVNQDRYSIGCSAAMFRGITAKEIELIHRLIAEIQSSEGYMVQ